MVAVTLLAFLLSFRKGISPFLKASMAHNGTHGLYVVDYEIARANMNSTVVTEAV